MQCAINASPNIVFLDHISPLASLLKMPLIVADAENAELTKKYYPEVELRYLPDLEERWGELLDEFEVLFGCTYWEPRIKYLFNNFYGKNPRLVFCPHGQSDKGFSYPFLNRYRLQETILLYGSLMKEMLTELNLWNEGQSHEFVGNFRFRYYQQHRERLRASAEKEIFSSLNPTNKTVLYAPTWKDEDNAGTLFALGEKIFKDLPSDWNLVLKIHPLIHRENPELFYRLSFIEKQRSNFVLVHEFPAIYPILDKVDIYLGDYSSIGYDMLTFQKPMFFLQQAHLGSVRLHSCGQLLDPSQHIFKSIEAGLKSAESFHPQQRALYAKAFADV